MDRGSGGSGPLKGPPDENQEAWPHFDVVLFLGVLYHLEDPLGAPVVPGKTSTLSEHGSFGIMPDMPKPANLDMLVVAHFYAPSIKTGTVRPTALARHLRAGGHRVTVLTTSADGRLPSDSALGVVRTWDLQNLQSQRARSSMETNGTYSTRPHPLSRILVPDAHLLAWGPFAFARALRLAGRHGFDCVLTTSPPESVHLVGAALSLRGLPWIADLRDGWGFEPIMKQEMWPTRIQHRISERMERRLLSRADAVTAITKPVIDDLRRRLGVEAELVPNGWEPELEPVAPEELPDLDPDRVSVIFTGMLAGAHRDPKPLIAGVARLASDDPVSARRLEIVFAGSFTEEERSLFATDVAPARLREVGRLSGAQVAALQRKADAALLINHPTRIYESGSKLFEYIGAGLPILALARTDGAAAEIVTAANGLVVPTHDVDAIARGLRSLVQGEVGVPSGETREAYSWPVLTERLVEVAREAIIRHTNRVR
jgi:glycosyltransferase involved in cell wall biosynthesis